MMLPVRNILKVGKSLVSDVVRIGPGHEGKSLVSDVVVIGGGHEGCGAAIRAAQKGFKVVCIEKLPTLGGPLPPKALLNFYEAKDGTISHSLVEAMIAQRNKTTACFTKGMEGLFRKNGVNHIKGLGRFVSPNLVCATDAEGKVVAVRGRHIIIATGCTFRPSASYILAPDNKIVSSSKALALSEIPKRAVVIGSSYISLEIASVWARLGSEVIVVELAPDILPTMDAEIRKELQSTLVKQKLKFMLKTKVVGIDDLSSPGVKLTIQSASDGQHSTLETDVVLVPDRRVPNTSSLCLEKFGVDIDVNTGGINIDERFMTSLPHVYAIGDVATARPMLAANKASKDAAECVKMIAGGLSRVDFDKVPGILYTDPGVGSIGMTEEQVKGRGLEYLVHIEKLRKDEGMAKILEDKRTKKVLGVHIISPTAEERLGDVLNALKYSDEARYVVARIARGPHLDKTRPSAWNPFMIY